jgi:hypothetical protein
MIMARKGSERNGDNNHGGHSSIASDSRLAAAFSNQLTIYNNLKFLRSPEYARDF